MGGDGLGWVGMGYDGLVEVGCDGLGWPWLVGVG